jgi:AraC-like DNA-binding protein
MRPIAIRGTTRQAATAGQPSRPSAGAMQRHYTIAELARTCNLSPSTILRIFKSELGVLRIGNVNSRKRVKISLRIPEDVAKEYGRD